MKSLEKWNALRSAIVEAKTVDEVKNIRDKAQVMKAYAKQIGESLECQNDISEIKIRAEHRVGEMLLESERHLPGPEKKDPSHDMRDLPKLKDIGITYNQSSQWQSIAKIPEEVFENHISETKQSKKELTSASVLQIVKKQKREEKLKEYNERVKSKAETKVENNIIPNLVLADPPWRYEFSETTGRKIENHYNTENVSGMVDDIPETKPDCILFLWATAPKLQEAFELMGKWGFEYKTCAVWDKEIIGMGYWFRGQHELLLVGVKGNVSPPLDKFRVSSIFKEKRTKHSKKPICVYEWIEKTFGDKDWHEMYCRYPRPGWSVSGDEV